MDPLSGGKEVEVIGESASETTGQKGTAGHRVSCRGLGEADHEGWLSKKGEYIIMGMSNFISYVDK